MMNQDACGNCGAPLYEQFCQNCGQRRAEKISISRVLRDGFGRLLDLDTGILFTFRELSLRPGAFVRGYLAGKRQSCTNPLKYCFIVVTVYALTINFLDINFDLGDGVEFDQQERQVFHIIHGFLAYLTFLILFPVAALQRWLFRDSGLSFSESYVFGLFVIGHGTWIAVLIALSGLMSSIPGLLIVLLAQLIYLIWAMQSFYAPGGRPPVFRAMLIFATNAICSNLLALVVGNLIVRLGLVEPLPGTIA